jgi:hypothetical protein
VKPVAVVAGLAAVMLLTGCSMPGEGSDAGTTTGQDARPSNQFTFAKGITSTTWLTEEGAERTPVKKLYGVFRRPQKSSESQIAHPCSTITAGGEDRGKPISGLRRILLRDVGRRRYELLAQPTTSNDLNLGLSPEGLSPEGSAGCGATPMTADGLILGAEEQDGDGLVYGMVGDGVVSLDVVVDGVRYHARLGENGFAAHIPDARGKVVEKLVLVRKNGSKSEFPPD